MDATITIPEGHEQIGVVGPEQRNLKIIRETLGVSVAARGREITLRGDPVSVGVARRTLETLAARAHPGGGCSREQLIAIISEESTRARSRDNGTRLRVYSAGRRVEARTEAQRHMLDQIARHDLTFAIGPAGTGKTYLAVASAVHALREGAAGRVILCRPAVEAGEKLGFLPGDLEAKVNPYLRPLLDALHEMMDYKDIRRFVESDVIEIVPLAFMRGRTLNDSFVILDEAQNSTSEQMKMFLTRLGFGSKAVITGDITQTDLPTGRRSGLADAAKLLSEIEGIRFCYFTEADVVRHPLVAKIVRAYDLRDEARRRAEEEAEGESDDQ